MILSCSLSVSANELSLACNARNGEVKSSYTCPKSNIPLPVKTCVFQNSYGETQFFNGCSGPSGGHSKIFYNSCIKHDLCYHHEPATNGYTQKSCDKNLRDNMITACETSADDISKCIWWAKALYRGLRIIGTAAYHCSDELSRSYE